MECGYYKVCVLLLMYAGQASGQREDPVPLEDPVLQGNKLEALMFRQAQDMATMMADVKSLMRHQIQQRHERRDGVSGSCSGDVIGLTTLHVQQSPLVAPCDGHGWVVIMRRVDNSHDFSGRGWDDYKHGFGNPGESFWLGLENMHMLSTQHSGSVLLRVELEAWDGETAWAQYTFVRVLDESSGYRLMVDGYSGTAGDSLAYHNGMKFTTKDRDNDEHAKNCAEQFGGAWWHSSCFYACLTADYIEDGSNAPAYKGLVWYHWRGDSYSYKSAVMKLLLQ